MKYLIFLVTVTFSIISNAAYTTMTLEGVQQANGVWTAVGVMDNMGFVRTTGAVTVSGTTASTAVALPVEKVAASTILRGASKALGPIALAATAYDVYEWFTSSDITANGNAWASKLPIGNCKYNGYSDSRPNHTLNSCIQFMQDIKGSGYLVAYQYTDSNGKLAIGSGSKVGCSGGQCPLSNIGYFFPLAIQPEPDQSVFDRIPIPSFSVMSNGFNKIPSLAGQPIPITGLQFPPFSSWLGEPYFKDGNWFRDRADISPCPTASQPTRVCVDIGPQKFEGATDPQTIPSQATGTATGTTPKEQTDFCKKNPQSIACAELGQLEDEQLEIIELPVSTSYTPWGSSNASCPSPRTISLIAGKSVTISYQPTCDFVAMIRPLIIGLALISAMFIIGGISRSGGGD